MSKNAIRISDSQGNEELTIIGTEQQIGLLREMAGSLQRGTLLQDVLRLIPQPQPVEPALSEGMARTDKAMRQAQTMVTESDNQNIRGLDVRLMRCSSCQQNHRRLHFERMDGFEAIHGLAFPYRATCPRTKQYVYLRFEDTIREASKA